LIQELLDALKPGEHMLSETTFAKLAAHLMLLKNLFVWCLCVFLILGLPFLCVAQELEPRRWKKHMASLEIKTYTEFDKQLRFQMLLAEISTLFINLPADRIDSEIVAAQSSIRPSIEAGMGQLLSKLEPETWRKSHCPVCGSLPSLNLLKGEGGKRYSLCSYCGYQWRIDRLSCSVCDNKEQKFLKYFYGEGEESYRIDLCDKCHHYIKTIDVRDLEESDPSLEDLATLHLDVVAAQKGYERSVPNPWAA
jgi:formate dehydrogenase accessory protein FdhE